MSTPAKAVVELEPFEIKNIIYAIDYERRNTQCKDDIFRRQTLATKRKLGKAYKSIEERRCYA